MLIKSRLTAGAIAIVTALWLLAPFYVGEEEAPANDAEPWAKVEAR